MPVDSVDHMYLKYTYSRERREEMERLAMEKRMRPILVVHDSRSSVVFAHDVEKKGLQGTSAKNIVQDLKDMGYVGRDIVLKSDQEPALKAVIDEVALQRPSCRTSKPIGRVAVEWRRGKCD